VTSTPPEADTYPVLDTLRFFGAFGVLLTHVAFWTGGYTAHPVTGPLMARLDAGVALFFVLSGFLLSRKWLMSAAQGRATPDVRRYLWRRLLRIYPLYVVTALLAIAFIEENARMSLGDVLVTVGLLGIYVDPALPGGLTHMWSLATEVSFYLALPALMALAVGLSPTRLPVRRVLLLVGGMWVVSLVWLGGLAHELPGVDDVPVHEWLPAFGGWFGAGIALALADVLVTRGEEPRWLRRVVDVVASQPGACWVLVLGLMLVAATPLAGPTLLVAPTDAQVLTKNLLYLVAAAIAVATGVFARPGTTYHRLMSLPLARHLGRTSYAVFCIHMPVLHLVRRLTDYQLFSGDLFLVLFLTLAISLVAAELLYRLVEKPFMRLKDKGPGAATRKTAPARAASTR
jgi:peptidoglycan/LPS O-acetylase OafA/YrhL